MISPTVKVNLKGVEAATRKIGRRGKNARAVFESLKVPLKTDVKETFKREEGSDSKWPPVKRARFTKGKRGPRKRKTLGRLRGFSITVTRGFIRGVSKIPWSGIHQRGGTAGHGAKIPQREHLYASQPLIDLAKRKLATWMANGKI